MAVALTRFIEDELLPVVNGKGVDLLPDFVTDTIHINGNGLGQQVLNRREVQDNWREVFQERAEAFIEKMPKSPPPFDFPIKNQDHIPGLDDPMRNPPGLSKRLRGALDSKFAGRISGLPLSLSYPRDWGHHWESHIVVPCRNNTADIAVAWDALELEFHKDVNLVRVADNEKVYVRIEPEVDARKCDFGWHMSKGRQWDETYETSWVILASYARLIVSSDPPRGVPTNGPELADQLSLAKALDEIEKAQ